MNEMIWASAFLAMLTSCGVWLRRSRRDRAAGQPSSQVQSAFQPIDGLPSVSHVRNRACEKRGDLKAMLAIELPALLEHRLSVGQLMSRDVVLARPTTPLNEIAAIMAERRVRHMPVCDAKGRLMGVVSDRDVVVRKGLSAKDIMSLKPVSISSRAPVGDAVGIMLSQNISCLPVYERDEICGILTSSDVMLGLQLAYELLQESFPRNELSLSGA
jgi:CBS domain-containing protein